jgi:hypothetical protein
MFLTRDISKIERWRKTYYLNYFQKKPIAGKSIYQAWISAEYKKSSLSENCNLEITHI